MSPERGRRRGVVLLAALLVLGVAGAFLVAGYFAEHARLRGALDAERSARLHAGAHGGLADLVAGWDSAARFRQRVGQADPVALVADLPGQRVAAVLTRLSTWSYAAAVSAADAHDSSLAARLSSVITIDAPVLPLLGSLVAQHGVVAEGTLLVTGVDSASPVACGEPPVPVAGVVVAPGDPAPPGAVERATAGDDSLYARFGNVTVGVLAARADVVLPSRAIVGAPIGNVIYDTGDLDLSGGVGRGVLLVGGTLRITGDVTFEGVIIASGGIDVTGRAHVTGLALAGGDSTPSVFVKASGTLELHSDPCVVTDVTWHAGRPVFPTRDVSQRTP